MNKIIVVIIGAMLCATGGVVLATHNALGIILCFIGGMLCTAAVLHDD